MYNKTAEVLRPTAQTPIVTVEEMTIKWEKESTGGRKKKRRKNGKTSLVFAKMKVGRKTKQTQSPPTEMTILRKKIKKTLSKTTKNSN